VYGSYAPDAPHDVFLEDHDVPALWQSPERYYLLAEGPQIPRLEKLLGRLNRVKESGGKFLLTNR
jgi:hypothetical protein